MATFAVRLEHPRARFLVVVLALLVTLPALFLGFVTDDHAFRALLHAPAPYGRPAFDLFRFASGVPAETEHAILTGHAPWWTALDLRIHFVRPLTGLLFAADDALAGSHALFYHLHSIVWYLALVLAVGALYRRLFPSGPTAFLAVLVFALSHTHVGPFAWVAARHVLVGAVPAVIALWAHVRWREDAWRPGRFIGPLSLVVGLAGSEVALGGAVFWLSYDFLGDRDRGRAWRARLAAAAPALVIVAAYLVVYRFVGGGARASGGYHDPTSDPLGFAQVASTRVPVLLGDALLGVPAELANVVSPARLAAVGLAAIAFVALAFWLCRSAAAERERAALRWLLPAALVTTLLGATGFPGGRVLLLPNVGFAALLGVLLARGFAAGPRWPLRVGLSSVLVLVHLVLAPLSSLRAMATLGHRGRASEAIASRLADVAPPDGRVFLVASDPDVFLYPRGILADVRPGAVQCTSILSAAHAGHRFTRVDARTLAVEPIERTMLDGSFDTLFRARDRPFAAGDTFRQCGAVIRVTDTEGGRPARIEVRFDRPLDAPDLVVMVWREHRLEPLPVLAAGESVKVPWSAGPMGL